MPVENSLVTKLLDAIVDHLDIPKSYYEKAAARHKALGEWLCRPESKVAAFQPHVSPQGSFRYGTVNRPLIDDRGIRPRQRDHAPDGEDRDDPEAAQGHSTARRSKDTQRQTGCSPQSRKRIAAGASVYADEVNFHLDTLPCVPEEQAVILGLTSRGVPPELAALAIAITDRRHPQYDQITSALLSSNPRGFAKWFERRARPVAETRLRQLVERRLYASVEDVPPYEWKTPLQRSIQILKRHRDVMFQKNPGVGPISMIITNLAAHAYAGETDVWSALTNIVERMPQYVKPTRPRVPNPADPAEDYADKWARNPALEENFWLWHTQVKVDLAEAAGRPFR